MRAFSYVLLLLIFLMIILSMTSCRVLTTSVSSTSDSTRVTEKLRLIPIKVPGDSVQIRTAPLPCDPITLLVKPAEFIAKSKTIKAKATIDKKGVLQVDCKYDSLQEVIKALDREVFRLRNQSKTITVTEHTPTKFDVFARWYFGITALLLIAASILWVKKKLPFF